MAAVIALDAAWMREAACKGRRVTVEMCHVCPVRGECLDWAMSLPPHLEIDEVAGGLTLDERNDLRRRNRPAPDAEPDPDEPTKRCSYCHETKPVSLFYRRSAARDGLDSHCKACTNEIGARTRRRRMGASVGAPGGADVPALRRGEVRHGVQRRPGARERAADLVQDLRPRVLASASRRTGHERTGGGVMATRSYIEAASRADRPPSISLDRLTDDTTLAMPKQEQKAALLERARARRLVLRFAREDADDFLDALGLPLLDDAERAALALLREQVRDVDTLAGEQWPPVAQPLRPETAEALNELIGVLADALGVADTTTGRE